MCLMAEGPNDGEGDGKGTTSNFTITNNYCETLKASQNIMIEDIPNCVITGNTFAGSSEKAIGLDLKSTGAKVSGNTLSGPKFEVGMDSTSKPGYQGPEPQGGP